MKRQCVPFAAVAMMMGTMASADPFVDAVVKNFQDMGYQFVEIERGQTQLRAEGVRGTQELEVIYDLATGQIIRQETGTADAWYVGRSGVEIESRNRDFVGRDDFDDDDDDDDRSSGRDDFDDDDDDDDRSSSGSSRDDNDDDDDDNDSSGSSSNSSSDDNDDDNDDDD
jgi:hypothetical protein